MNIEKIIKNNTVYLAGDEEKQGALLSVCDMIPEDVIRNCVIVAGNINSITEVTAFLLSAGRLKNENIECHLVFQDDKSYSDDLNEWTRRCNIEGQVWFAATPEKYETDCREYIEAAVLGQENHFFRKQQCFVKNQCDAVYGKLKELF